MKEVNIQIIRLQPFQTRIACAKRALMRCIRRQNFAYQKHFFATSVNRLSNNLLRAGIHLRRVDVRHAEIDAGSERFDSAPLHLPGSLSDDWDLLTGLYEVVSERGPVR